MQILFLRLIACAATSLFLVADILAQPAASNLSDQVQLLISEGKYDSASALAHSALDSATFYHGNTDTSVATIHLVLGWIAYFQEDIAESGHNWTQCLAIRETALDPDDPQIAEVLYALSIYHRWSDDVPSSEQAIRRAIKILDESELTETEDYWIYKRALARTLKIRQDFEGVLEIYQQVLAHELTQSDTLTESFGDVLNDIACAFSEQKMNREAESYFERAAAVWREALPPAHPSLVTVLSSLAVMRYLMGDYERSEEYCRQADSILTLSAEPMEHLVSDVKILRASNRRACGNYRDAETLYLEAVAIKSDVLGADHSETALAKESLGDLYMDQGRFEDAANLYEQSRLVYEKLYGQNNVQLVPEWTKRASVLLAMNRLDEAALSADKALQLCQSATNPPQLLRAATMMTLASIRGKQGNAEEALPLLKAAREIRTTELGAGHLLTLRTRYAYAEALMRNGQIAAANQEVDEALALSGLLLNGQHALHADLLALSARIKTQLGMTRESRTMADSAWSEMRRGFSRNVSALTERDALDYSVKLRAQTERYLGLLLQHQSDANTRRIFEVVLATHGQVTDELAARRRRSSSPAEDSLRAARFEYAKYLYASTVDTAARYTHLYGIASNVERWETGLAHELGTRGLTQDTYLCEPSDVNSNLTPHTVLAEYFTYSASAADSTMGMAVLLYTWQGELAVADLGPLDEVRLAVKSYCDHMNAPRKSSKSEYAVISRAVTDKLWSPITPYLEGASTVLIAPDDCVNLISFAGLLDSSARYLVEDYTIHYLTSAADMCRKSEADVERASSGLLVLGDPDFDMELNGDGSHDLSHPASNYFSARSVCLDAARPPVPRLPHSRLEAESVAKTWSQNGSEPVKLLLGAQATESAMLSELENCRVAHLATHGFFLGASCDTTSDAESSRTEDPMLRCGIFLAGVNKSGKPAHEVGEEDGIVPARSIASLNLRGMDIAVLSACESAIGDVHAGEGLWGLRRAFELAGARCVLSSLWKIDDRSAADLVSGVFLSQSQPIASALRDAALRYVAQARTTGRSDHPFYWAGFVATGDPNARIQQ